MPLQPQEGRDLPKTCGHTALVNLGKGRTKGGTEPAGASQWLAGEAKRDANGQPSGGSAQDDVAATTRWDAERAANIRLLEVRGVLPDEVTDPDTGISFAPKKGTVPKKSHYACSACGTVQDGADYHQGYGQNWANGRLCHAGLRTEA